MDRKQAKRELYKLIESSVNISNKKTSEHISLRDLAKYMGKSRGYFNITLNNSKSNLSDYIYTEIHHAIFRYANEYGYIFINKEGES